MPAAILAEGLTKSYGPLRALDGVDLAVAEGTVLGLLGPNGAGKTTAVRILTTLLAPDRGRAAVLGLDVVEHAAAVRAAIGLAGQYAAVDEHLTGRENLRMVARLYHLGRREAERRATQLLERFDLTTAAERPAKTYSGGMRRRLDLAASLLNRPRVLFLDEPTSGLDPRSRADLWALIEELVTEGTTVLLTSQYLEEVDRLADRISVLDDGRVIAEGTSQELKARVGGEFLDVRVADGAQVQTAVSELAPLAAGEPLVDPAEGLVSVPVAGATGLLAEAVRRLDAAGLTIRDLALRGPTLDDVFLTLTGRAPVRQAAQPGAPGRRRVGRGRQGPRRASRSAA